MQDPERFAAGLVELFGELDWTALGAHYCHEGGDDFFDEAARDALLDAELCFASDVSDVLASAAPATSLYVGAAVSELGPMLCETLVLGRDVRALSLDNPETRELNRALAIVAERLDAPLPRIETAAPGAVALPPCTHVWMVSVLNDPESFPALHDELYGRRGTELATGGGDLDGERVAANALLDRLFTALAPPAIFTCSYEELPLVRGAAHRRGVELAGTLPARLSPVVWDPVRCWRVTDGVSRPG